MDHNERELEPRTESELPRFRAPPGSVLSAVHDLSEGMSSLVRSHLALARIEMSKDLRNLASDIFMELAGVPLLAAGYLLSWVAIGFLLALVMPAWLAFAICALSNVLLGLGVMAWGLNRIKKQKLGLKSTQRELDRDKAWLADLTRGQRQLPH